MVEMKNLAATVLSLVLVASIWSPPASASAYFGFDWLDFYEASGTVISAANAAEDVSGSLGPGNLNVVHKTSTLDQAVCSNSKCVIGVSAGSNPVWADICPDKKNSDDCTGAGSYKNIWKIVSEIKSRRNLPAAIYFIDEPFGADALKNEQKKYVKGQYSGYLCTLRQAMAAADLRLPVFTILSIGQAQTQEFVDEIQHGRAGAACEIGGTAILDWIGVDNYKWTDPAAILAVYESVAPKENPAMPKWVLVPPSTRELDPEHPDVAVSDAELQRRIQAYFDLYTQNSNLPVIYVMNWRYDFQVMRDASYARARRLLSVFEKETLR